MVPVVTAPWIVVGPSPSRSLKIRAATISAAHWPRPAFMFSFFASTIIMTGASGSAGAVNETG